MADKRQLEEPENKKSHTTLIVTQPRAPAVRGIHYSCSPSEFLTPAVEGGLSDHYLSQEKLYLSALPLLITVTNSKG